MTTLARFEIVGRVGKNAADLLKSSKSGVTYLTVGVAINEPKKGAYVTSWFDMTFFNEIAIRASQKLHAGDLVLFRGSISVSKFTDRHGIEQKSNSFVVNEFFIMKSATEKEIAVTTDVPITQVDDPQVDDPIDQFDDAVPF